MNLEVLEQYWLQVGVVLLSLVTVAAWWLIKSRQNLADQQLAQMQQQLHDKDLALQLALQTANHLTARESELQTTLTNTRHELSAQREGLAQANARLAIFEHTNAQVVQLTRSLEQRDQQYRELLAKYGALEAKSAAEKISVGEKLKLLQDTRDRLTEEFGTLANKIFDDKQQRFVEQSQQVLKISVDPLKEQIESFRKKVEDAYDKENAERNKLVGQIAQLQKQTQQIGDDAVNLTNALKGDNKAQGNWGEVILERLLEASGLHNGREYEVQVSLKDEHGKRRNPDVIVRLPEGKDIVIDSKVSLVNFERSVSATDDAQRDAALKQHLMSVRTHISQLSAKSYDKLEGLRSLDFVFLFVPVEAAFMSALQADPQLFQDAYDKHILLVSPTTLLASLRTIENIWRYEKQNRNAEEIARQAGGLHDQFVLLFEAFEDVGKQIEKAGDAYTLTRKRLVSGRGNVMRRIEGLRELGAKTKKQLNHASESSDDGACEPQLPAPDREIETP